LTFSLGPGSTRLVITSWDPRLSGNQIALSGIEDLNIDLANPVLDNGLRESPPVAAWMDRRIVGAWRMENQGLPYPKERGLIAGAPMSANCHNADRHGRMAELPFIAEGVEQLLLN
jgi:hypothetical protein